MLLINNNKLILNGKFVLVNKKEKSNPNTLIMYTSSTDAVIEPKYNDFGGANIISNTYENGVGVIKFDAEVTSIGYGAFLYCTKLNSITIPDSVTSIGEFAFDRCQFTSFTIPNSVTSIGLFAFKDCNSLTSVTIPNSVTSIGERAFDSCTKLNSIIIPDSVTSIGERVFDGCRNLISITVDVNNTVYDSRDNCNAIIETETNILIRGCQNTVIPDLVTIIGISAFDNCEGLTSITIPNSVTSIGTYAFSNCTSLSSVVIGDSVTSIGERAFDNCSSLTSITIPNSVTSIGSYAFLYCSGFTSITIPNSVTSIGSYVLSNCTKLRYVTIGDLVTSIGSAAFSYCKKINSVTINAINPPTLGSSAFSLSGSSFVIYVPEGSVDAYKTATNWSSYASKIKPIS